METRIYTIRDLSQMFDLPASTLRYYEEIGLLENVQHTSGQKRVYTQEHLDRLNAIRCFKQTGLSLGRMLLFFEYEKDLPSNIEAILQLMEDQEADIQEHLKELQEGLLHIQDKVRYYSGIRQAISDGQPWPTWEECMCSNSQRNCVE